MSLPLKVLILDNYDSFVYNLYQRIGEISGVASRVVRNDRITLDEIAAYEPTHIVVSPGPGNPEDPAYFGICRQVILRYGPTTPILGVCLGHQGLASAYGGRVVRAHRVMHGKTSLVDHDAQHLFKGVPTPFVTMRYHSLVVDPESVPACLEVTAQTSSGTIMALRHRTYPTYGVQFHPESIGTPYGIRLIANFLGRGEDTRVRRLVEDANLGIDARRTPAPAPARAFRG